jgi:peptidoglycan/xylan/chitin deacetylase (PgdA/CDA1 family)
METDSDDEGDPAAARILLLATCLLFCYQPQSHSRAKATLPRPLAQSLAKAKHPAARPHKTRKKLYLTFDDGPNKGTHNVYRIVTDEQVPVTFFIVGEHVFDTRWQHALFDSLQSSANIAVCNHSFSHAHSRYKAYYERPDSVVADFHHTQDTLDLDNPIARTPGRNCWRIDSLHCTDLKASTAAVDSLQQAGFTVMGWDAEWYFDHKTFNVQQDAGTLLRQVDSIFARNRTKRAGHLVLLAHDQAFAKSADSLQLRLFLQALKTRDDLELVLATSYPGANTTTVAAAGIPH